jgi:hypothetical protein
MVGSRGCAKASTFTAFRPSRGLAQRARRRDATPTALRERERVGVRGMSGGGQVKASNLVGVAADPPCYGPDQARARRVTEVLGLTEFRKCPEVDGDFASELPAMGDHWRLLPSWPADARVRPVTRRGLMWSPPRGAGKPRLAVEVLRTGPADD